MQGAQQELSGVLHFFSETGTEGGYWAFQDGRFITPSPSPGIIPPSWSYEGLHVLEDGDELTILSPEDRATVVWSGTITLVQLGLFTDDAFGYWIHADQQGMDRETWARWFFQEFPARLKKAAKEEARG